MTEAEPAQGYFKGDWWPIVVRVLILVIDIEFVPVLILYIMQFRKAQMNVITILAVSAPAIFWLVFQEYLIFEHSLGCPNVSPLVLV